MCNIYIPYEEKIIRKRECIQRACWTVVSLLCDIQKLHRNKHWIQWLQHLCVMMMIYTRRGRGDNHACITRKGKERTCDGSHTYMPTRPSKTALEISNVDSRSVKNPVYVCTSSSSYPRPTQKYPSPPLRVSYLLKLQ